MSLLLDRPIGISAIGNRQNNEDAIYPFVGKALQSDKLFVVCDGVGGQQKGDVASALACQSFAQFFQQYPNHLVNDTFIRRAVSFVEDCFDKYLKHHKDARGMATTFVLVYFEGNEVVVAHGGDSRLYHIRGNACLFRTEDHTPLNDMLRQGFISPEEVVQDKRNSQISRALQGTSVRTLVPEINILQDVQVGDIFCLCTDGVWDSFEGEDLLKLLTCGVALETMAEHLDKHCAQYAQDNFSAYLLKVQAIEEAKNSIVPVLESPSEVKSNASNLKLSIQLWVGLSAVFVMTLSILFFVWKPSETSPNLQTFLEKQCKEFRKNKQIDANWKDCHCELFKFADLLQDSSKVFVVRNFLQMPKPMSEFLFFKIVNTQTIPILTQAKYTSVHYEKKRFIATKTHTANAEEQVYIDLEGNETKINTP
jgi:protein phosphatase